MSHDLACLQGQNQNEQLAVPLLRLAGALQAALAWQQKVCYLLQPPSSLSITSACLHTHAQLDLPLCCFTRSSASLCKPNTYVALDIAMPVIAACAVSLAGLRAAANHVIKGCCCTLQASSATKQTVLVQVGQYSADSIADSQHSASVRKQPSQIRKQHSVSAKRSGSRERQRALLQMEAQLRATRQDALQLATAVVRLEKEKAVLQSQVSDPMSLVSLCMLASHVPLVAWSVHI